MKKLEFFFVILSACLILEGCNEIKPVSLEERLPMFDWISFRAMTVYHYPLDASFLELVDGIDGLHYNTSYDRFLFQFDANKVTFSGMGNNYPEFNIIATDTWNIDSDRITFGKEFNIKLAENFGLPAVPEQFETLSYRGYLYLGARLIDETWQSDLFFFITLEAEEED